jgi:hypothetical protein
MSMIGEGDITAQVGKTWKAQEEETQLFRGYRVAGTGLGDPLLRGAHGNQTVSLISVLGPYIPFPDSAQPGGHNIHLLSHPGTSITGPCIPQQTKRRGVMPPISDLKT